MPAMPDSEARLSPIRPLKRILHFLPIPNFKRFAMISMRIGNIFWRETKSAHESHTYFFQHAPRSLILFIDRRQHALYAPLAKPLIHQ